MCGTEKMTSHAVCLESVFQHLLSGAALEMFLSCCRSFLLSWRIMSRSLASLSSPPEEKMRSEKTFQWRGSRCGSGPTFVAVALDPGPLVSGHLSQLPQLLLLLLLLLLSHLLLHLRSHLHRFSGLIATSALTFAHCILRHLAKLLTPTELCFTFCCATITNFNAFHWDLVCSIFF